MIQIRFLVAVRRHGHNRGFVVTGFLFLGWLQWGRAIIAKNPQAFVVGEVDQAVATVRKKAGDFVERLQRLRIQ